ncbi:MAG: signal peptidase II [Erysipelotrichales bacterium]|nr:signal peptidase II [Erysipelotrichales bacterium]
MNKKIVIISSLILFLDQLVKSIVEINEVHFNLIANFLKFNYSQNTGAAFSILQGKIHFLILISVIMLIIIYSMTFSYEESKISNCAFGLLFGGILGNLVDRIFYGFVRDFIDINILGYNFPIFNIADITIVVGVMLLILATIKGEVKNGNKGKRFRRENKN